MRLAVLVAAVAVAAAVAVVLVGVGGGGGSGGDAFGELADLLSRPVNFTATYVAELNGTRARVFVTLQRPVRGLIRVWTDYMEAVAVFDASINVSYVCVDLLGAARCTRGDAPVPLPVSPEVLEKVLGSANITVVKLNETGGAACFEAIADVGGSATISEICVSRDGVPLSIVQRGDFGVFTMRLVEYSAGFDYGEWFGALMGAMPWREGPLAIDVVGFNYSHVEVVVASAERLDDLTFTVEIQWGRGLMPCVESYGPLEAGSVRRLAWRCEGVEDFEGLVTGFRAWAFRGPGDVVRIGAPWPTPRTWPWSTTPKTADSERA